MQFLASQPSRGELTETTIHTEEVIVNMQYLVNSYALRLDGCHGAIKTGKILLRSFLELMDCEGNPTSAGEWLMMSRVNKCAQQLYPYSSISAIAWAERAYRRWATEGIAPEYLRDRQSTGLLNLINKRPPRL